MHAYQPLAVSLNTVYIPLFATINQRLLYGKCFSNGSCDRFCNNFRKSVVPDDPPDRCAFCLHDVSAHEIAGAIDRDGNVTFNRATLPTPAPVIPVLSIREKQRSFNRTGVYVPNSAGVYSNMFHLRFVSKTLHFHYISYRSKNQRWEQCIPQEVSWTCVLNVTCVIVVIIIIIIRIIIISRF